MFHATAVDPRISEDFLIFVLRSSHHGRGTHDDGIGLVAIVSPSSSLTNKHGPSILVPLS